MVNLLEYPETSSYQISRVFRKKEDSVVALVRKSDSAPFVCRIYDHPVPGYRATGELAIPQLPATYQYRTKDGSHIVEEEYVDGINLTELLEVYRPDVSQTAAIGEQVCRALQALHEKGVIHRDVKPDNVLVTSEGRVVLIDLDAASEYDPEKERDTCLLGTAGYAAPEQFGFSRSDVRTDIFSLGVMLNVMLTGEHPSRKLAEGAIRPVIERCIEVNADKRFSSAAELGKKLAALAGEDAICPQCGCVTPGGGCMCCGIPSASGKTAGKKRPIAAVLLFAVMVCALLLTHWAGRNEPASEPLPPQPEQSDTAEKEPPAPGIVPVPVKTGEKETEVETEIEIETGDQSAQMPIYSGKFVFGNHMSEPFPAVIDGEEQMVCMAIDHCSQAYPNQSGSHSLAMVDGEYIDLFYGVGFFCKVGEDQYTRIGSSEKMEVIREKIGDSLKLEVLAYEAENRPLPERFPEITAHQCEKGCFDGADLKVGLENRGTYILCASATADGRELRSEFRLEWLPTTEIRFEYDPAGGEMIDQINNFLEDLTYDAMKSVTVDIPAGSYEGQIVVPEKLMLMEVRINGVSAESGPASVIRGGVENNNHRTILKNIRFEGAGAGLAEIPAQWPDGRENVAFSGWGGGVSNGCEFEGYSAAIRSTKRLKTGEGNLFENNGAGFLFDTQNADGGNSSMKDNEFRNNDIAIHFKSLNENWSLNWFKIKDCRFIDNETDLCNELGRLIEIQYGYYADTVDGAEVERECRTAEQ